MNILGIQIGHDSSVALESHGKVIADVAEERYTGNKHYSGLPIRSLVYCLKRVIDGLKEVIHYLAENKTVAWFKKRIERGPSASGNRHILMSTNKSGNKDSVVIQVGEIVKLARSNSVQVVVI